VRLPIGFVIMSQPREMIIPLTRGDEKLKIDNTPQAVVVSVGIVTTGALTGFLVWQGWSLEAIAAAAVAVGGVFAGQWASTRRTSVVDAKQDAQLDTLETIRHQTNGGLKATIDGAVATGIARGVAQALAQQQSREGDRVE
jgi:ABC-type Mn2+/Zn2+ transport system permease subunit